MCLTTELHKTKENYIHQQKYIKPKLTELKREIYKSTSIVGHINTPLLVIDRTVEENH